jgi:hypothetical protein
MKSTTYNETIENSATSFTALTVARNCGLVSMSCWFHAAQQGVLGV